MPFDSHGIIDDSPMTIIIKNIEKLFFSKFKNLDGQFWVQKVILKKYLIKN